MNSKQRTVISSTRKEGRVVAQQVVYREQGYSVTKHERILEDDKGNLKILSRKGLNNG